MTTDILPAEGLILCAVSGGVDSMYLLCRLREWNYPVAAAHFHHGLRGAEADRDLDFVRGFCERKNIPFISEKGDTAGYAASRHLGMEEAARVLRYAFLERAADRMGAAVIATAHTADDNAETILMNLVRGSGLHGLGGIPPVRGRIRRPMLDVSRREAEEYLESRKIPHVEDSSNRDDVFLRNRIRHHVLPLLKAENPAFLAALFRTAKLVREDDEFLNDLADAFLAENADGESIDAEALCGLPRPIALRAIRRRAGSISLEHTEAILRAAREGGAAEVTGLRAERFRNRLYVGVVPAAPLPDRVLRPGCVLALPEAGLKVFLEKIDVMQPDVHKSFNTFFFKCANIYGNITVTARKPGDCYRPAGRGCTKTLKALMEEKSVPPWKRPGVPVLRDDLGILAMVGAPAAERVCAEPEDRDLYKIEFVRDEPDEKGQQYASGR